MHFWCVWIWLINSGDQLCTSQIWVLRSNFAFKVSSIFADLISHLFSHLSSNLFAHQLNSFFYIYNWLLMPFYLLFGFTPLVLIVVQNYIDRCYKEEIINLFSKNFWTYFKVKKVLLKVMLTLELWSSNVRTILSHFFVM